MQLPHGSEVSIKKERAVCISKCDAFLILLSQPLPTSKAGYFCKGGSNAAASMGDNRLVQYLQ